MAKVSITIEDVGGNVKVTLEPTAETLLNKIASHGPESLTAAEAYAMAAANHMRKISKQPGQIVVDVPRLGRR